MLELLLILCLEIQIPGFLSILQRAAPLLKKARALRLIEIGKQFRPNMDRLYCIIAVRRYHAIRAETKANRTDGSGQEKFLAAFREQVIEKQFRGFRMLRRDGYEGDARHQRDVVGRKHDADRSIFLGPFDRVGSDHILGDQMFAG